jgi:hypothetical protein
MANRRDFLRLTAALPGIAGVAALPGLAAAAIPAATPSGGAASAAVPREDSDVAWLFAPLAPGSDLGNGWLFARAFPVRDGGLTVNLVNRDGHVVRVDLCAIDGAPRGPVQSGLCDFIVMDGGRGRTPMGEDLGGALRQLAATVTVNEAAQPAVIAALMGLEPHADRVWRHRDAMEVAAVNLRPGGDSA